MRELKIKGGVAIVMIAIICSSFIRTHTWPTGMLADLETVSALILLLVLVYEKWLWRLPGLYPLLVETPIIEGAWSASGTITDPGGSNNRQVSATLKIEQDISLVWIEISWADGSISQLHDGAPFVVHGKMRRRFSLNAVYSFTDKNKNLLPVSREASVSMTVNNAKWPRHPNALKLEYIVSDGQRGNLDLSRIPT
jgi:hypothetical protein